MPQKINEYITTREIGKYVEVTRDIPGVLRDMLDIQNLGTKIPALANRK